MKWQLPALLNSWADNIDLFSPAQEHVNLSPRIHSGAFDAAGMVTRWNSQESLYYKIWRPLGLEPERGSLQGHPCCWTQRSMLFPLCKVLLFLSGFFQDWKAQEVISLAPWPLALLPQRFPIVQLLISQHCFWALLTEFQEFWRKDWMGTWRERAHVPERHL